MNTYKETCPPEINAQLPTLSWIMWRRRWLPLIIKVLGFGGFILYSQWQNPNWLFIGGILALLIIPEIGFARLIAWTTRPLTKYGPNDWVEVTSNNEIALYRDGRKSLAFPLAEAQWTDVENLQTLTKYSDLPAIHVFVIARSTNSGWSWWQKAPLIMCGFTTESRQIWQTILINAGLQQQHTK